MVTERTAILISRLEDQIASGIVWNADFEDLKFQLGREYDGAREEFLTLALHETSEGEYPAVREVYRAMPYGIFGLTSLAKKRFGPLPTWTADKLATFLTDWLPIRTLLYVVAKPLVKKGRKPPETPPLTAPRTLESTGTCPICGRNIKLEDGGMVNHGYSVEYHSFSGGCFGVGLRPWEIASEGAVRYIDALKVYVRDEKGIIASFENKTRTAVWSERQKKNLEPGDDSYRETLDSFLRELGYRIRGLERNIEYFESKVAGWAPATLPGIVAGFDR